MAKKSVAKESPAKKGTQEKSSQLLGGTTGGLTGECVDSAGGVPIPNMRVVAISPSQIAETYSDLNGRYSFLSLAPDTYTIAAEKAGYDPFDEPGVTVFADQTQTVILQTQKSLQGR